MADGQTSIRQVEGVLSEFRDPETGRSVTKLDQVRDIQLQDNALTVTLALTTYSAPVWEDTRTELIEFLKNRLPALGDVQVELAVHQRAPEKLGQIGLTAKSVIAVGSGKGGVGKSTISVSLAIGLNSAGCRVGILDADVYGPSVPHLLGLAGRAETEGGKLKPFDTDGLKVMSVGFLVPPGEAVIWRGPMLHHAMTNFLRDTDWGDLDYLIVDMPPGTGDVALSLSQMLPVTGAVVVCTPQEVALLDAVKAIGMLRKVNIPVLGVVENMSGFVCPDCNKRYDIFGSGGARKKAAELDVPFLGEVPINISIRTSGDQGQSGAVFEDTTVAPYLQNICHRLVSNLSRQHEQEPPLPSLSVL